MCDRWKQHPAALIHMFWDCPKLSNFWQLIFDMLFKPTDNSLEPSASLALFSVGTQNLILNNNKLCLLCLTNFDEMERF